MTWCPNNDITYIYKSNYTYDEYVCGTHYLQNFSLNGNYEICTTGPAGNGCSSVVSFSQNEVKLNWSGVSYTLTAQ
jgi:hypothetical protein